MMSGNRDTNFLTQPIAMSLIVNFLFKTAELEPGYLSSDCVAINRTGLDIHTEYAHTNFAIVY